MADDALSQWQRELQPTPPEPSGPDLATRAMVPMLLGIGIALAILFTSHWPPDVTSPRYLAVPLVTLAAAIATRRELYETLLWLAVACVSGGVAVVVAAPLWGLLEFFQCWASWLSDC